MAGMVPIDLKVEASGNTCCSNNKSARVVYNEDQNKFEQRDVNFLCCICGGGEARNENVRTWEAFTKGLETQYEMAAAQIPEKNIDLTQMKKSGKKMTQEHFDAVLQWARANYETRCADKRMSPVEEEAEVESSVGVKDEVENTVEVKDEGGGGSLRHYPSMDAHMDIRVRSESKEEDLTPSVLVEALATTPRKYQLSEEQINKVFTYVVQELITSGQRQITKKEVAELAAIAAEKLRVEGFAELDLSRVEEGEKRSFQQE